MPAAAVWHCRRRECALHTHTHHQSRSHLEGGGGNPICIRVLGGRRGKDERGPFHLSWSVQRNPLAVTAEVKIVKLENVQLLELQGIYLIHGVVRVARGGYLYWQACGKVRCLWPCSHSECRILSDGRRAGREKRQSRNTFPPLLFISLWREALLFSCCQISVFFFLVSTNVRGWCWKTGSPGGHWEAGQPQLTIASLHSSLSCGWHCMHVFKCLTFPPVMKIPHVAHQTRLTLAVLAACCSSWSEGVVSDCTLASARTVTEKSPGEMKKANVSLLVCLWGDTVTGWTV